jgi:hypothetical protein
MQRFCMTLDANETKAISDIKEHGCHILHVLEDDVGTCFSYSIGIEKTSKQPELIVTGLNQEISHFIINEYCKRVRDGESFKEGEFYSGFLEGFDVKFAPVAERHYKDYFGWGLWLYGGNNFRVHQLIWPSTDGTWPSEAPESSNIAWYIPPLQE